MKIDAVVAGAGVAGLAFAGRLSGYGHNVVVIEPAHREKLGHDWWDTIELQSFDRLGIDRPVPPMARSPFVFNLNVNGKTLPIVTRMPDDMVNVERRLFAAGMVEWALEAGVDIRFGHAAVQPVVENGSCRGVSVRNAAGQTETLTTPLTIDASGSIGILRRNMPRDFRATAGFDAGIEPGSIMHTWRGIAVDKSSGAPSIVCMDNGNSTSWISREPDGLVDVFAGVLGSANGDHPDPGDIARAMVRREGGIGKWVRPGSKWTIPLRRPFNGIVGPGFMLIGDSACMANPINGSGMSIAIDAAITAADCAHTAVLNDRFDESSLWSYPSTFFRNNAELAFLDSVKHFVFTAPREPMLSFMEAGGLRGPAFWKMRQEFTPTGLLDKLEAVRKMKGGHRLAIPMAAAISRAVAAEKLYSGYPGRYSPGIFSAWCKTVDRIFGKPS